MILGDPYKFAIIIKTIKEWNVDDTFCNGLLLFCVNGDIFPHKIDTATLKSEIYPLKKQMENIGISEELFYMKKKEAFKRIYNLIFLEEADNNSQFDMTPLSFADANYHVFGVSNGKQIRILSAKLRYIIEESRHELQNIRISEAFITLQEFREITSKLRIY